MRQHWKPLRKRGLARGVTRESDPGNKYGWVLPADQACRWARRRCPYALDGVQAVGINIVNKQWKRVGGYKVPIMLIPP